VIQVVGPKKIELLSKHLKNTLSEVLRIFLNRLRTTDLQQSKELNFHFSEQLPFDEIFVNILSALKSMQ
jgi:hypothetical protein